MAADIYLGGGLEPGVILILFPVYFTELLGISAIQETSWPDSVAGRSDRGQRPCATLRSLHSRVSPVCD